MDWGLVMLLASVFMVGMGLGGLLEQARIKRRLQDLCDTLKAIEEGRGETLKAMLDDLSDEKWEE